MFIYLFVENSISDPDVYVLFTRKMFITYIYFYFSFLAQICEVEG